MRGLPFWMIATLAALSVVLIAVGWHDMSHVGPLPLILGIVWGLFTLATLGAKLRPQDH